MSHLPQAHLVSPNTPIEQVKATVLKNVAPDQKIVVYCSVGVRSANFALKLQQAGFNHVYNLNGSLFAWANEHRPLYQGSQRVHTVHPYNAEWANLLLPQYREPLPILDANL